MLLSLLVILPGVILINGTMLYNFKPYILACCLIVLAIGLLSIIVNIIKSIKDAFDIKDWRVVIWNITISIISLVGSIFCIFYAIPD